jgi:hypothetical protein
MMLGGNEMAPRTDLEIAVVISISLAGSIINANIFGEMAVLVEMIQRKSNRVQNKIDATNTAMQNIKLPVENQKEIRMFLQMTLTNLDQ